MKILIIRHGQTDWNTLKKAQGQTDIPLNDTGRNQARKIADDLQGMSIDLIISSPLLRAKETADIIGKIHDIPVKVDMRAMERNLGIYEGTTADLTEIRYYHKNTPVENGEDTQTFTRRVFDFLDDLIETHKKNTATLLLVTHGMFLRSASWYFNGLPDKNESVTRFGNGQIDIYEI